MLTFSFCRYNDIFERIGKITQEVYQSSESLMFRHYGSHDLLQAMEVTTYIEAVKGVNGFTKSGLCALLRSRMETSPIYLVPRSPKPLVQDFQLIEFLKELKMTLLYLKENSSFRATELYIHCCSSGEAAKVMNFLRRNLEIADLPDGTKLHVHFPKRTTEFDIFPPVEIERVRARMGMFGNVKTQNQEVGVS